LGFLVAVNDTISVFRCIDRVAAFDATELVCAQFLIACFRTGTGRNESYEK
jgi:hypothetical protein